MLVSIVACQPKQEVMEKKADVMKKDTMEKMPETPQVETTGEALVDAVGSDLNNVDNVEKDLSADELVDFDSGLVDVQNIYQNFI